MLGRWLPRVVPHSDMTQVPSGGANRKQVPSASQLHTGGTASPPLRGDDWQELCEIIQLRRPWPIPLCISRVGIQGLLPLEPLRLSQSAGGDKLPDAARSQVFG